MRLQTQLGSALLISQPGKDNLFNLIIQIFLDCSIIPTNDMKIGGSDLDEKLSFNIFGLPFSSKSD